MRVLMLAPEPFFEPRGTPFSEYHRLKALSGLGLHIDLVTYSIGADVELPNLRIVRSTRIPFIRRVPIGPSWRKLLLDLFFAVTAIQQARRGRYDVIHSHEEAGVLGVWLARRLGVPHLYDMHSSLPQQLTNFRCARSRIANEIERLLLRRIFNWIERRTVAGSRVVITICPALQQLVTTLGAGDRALMIENVMGGDVDEPPSITAEEVRARYGLKPSQPVVLYTGTFEPYQGLDLLYRAAALLAGTHPDARVLVVGGTPQQVEEGAAHARTIGAPIVFAGQQQARDVPAFIEACTVLVSPRSAGTNTPLKVYSYLRSGRPIVATNLLTHTQVLDDTCAVLVPPEPGALAAAVGRLIDSPAERRRLAESAAQLSRDRYSREWFVARTREVYARLGAIAPHPAPGAVAAESSRA